MQEHLWVQLAIYIAKEDLGKKARMRMENKVICPSRAILGGKMLAFIANSQIAGVAMQSVGKGADGKVSLVKIEGEQWIDLETVVVKKEFHSKGKNDSGHWNKVENARIRKKAINKATIAGITHLGVVRAFAMITNRPTNLVFDYYNGRCLRVALNQICRHPNLMESLQDGFSFDDV
ncbi:unnamed protein product [Calypogeia fissa]